MAKTITNQSSTTYSFSDSSETFNVLSNENCVTLENNNGLLLTKTADVSCFDAGSIITYSINIVNASSQYLTGVRIIDDLGGGNLAYVIGSGRLSTGSQTYAVNPIATSPLTFTLQQLNVGASMTLTYKCQVIFNLPPSVDSITNSVRGIGYTSTGTVEGFSNFTIQKKSTLDLSINKSSSLTKVLPNQLFSYFITMKNNTQTEIKAIKTTDQLANNFIVTSVYLKIGSGSAQMLSPDDYTLSSDNLITIPSASGPEIIVPSNQSSVLTISGYFI